MLVGTSPACNSHRVVLEITFRPSFQQSAACVHITLALTESALLLVIGCEDLRVLEVQDRFNDIFLAL